MNTEIQSNIHLSDSQSPVSHTGRVSSANQLALRVYAVYEKVFAKCSVPQNSHTQASLRIQIPQSYTNLSEKLPNIHAPVQWSETVIQAILDTLVPLPSGIGYQYGSPIDTLVRVIQHERQSSKKELAFNVLLAAMLELEDLLPGFEIPEEQKNMIGEGIQRIRAISR